MKKFEILLAGVMAFSPALFAQQSTPQPDSQNSTASTAQTTTETKTTKTSKSKLTADQKAELKDLRTKAKDACKADKNSEACKSARQDLRAKMNDYGVKKHWHHKSKGMKNGSSTQSPS